jgi:hypothetical protein
LFSTALTLVNIELLLKIYIYIIIYYIKLLKNMIETTNILNILQNSNEVFHFCSAHFEACYRLISISRVIDLADFLIAFFSLTDTIHRLVIFDESQRTQRFVQTCQLITACCELVTIMTTTKEVI